MTGDFHVGLILILLLLLEYGIVTPGQMFHDPQSFPGMSCMLPMAKGLTQRTEDSRSLRDGGCLTSRMGEHLPSAYHTPSKGLGSGPGMVA